MRIHVHFLVSMPVSVYVCSCVGACTCVCVHLCRCMYVRVCVGMCVCVCASMTLRYVADSPQDVVCASILCVHVCMYV